MARCANKRKLWANMQIRLSVQSIFQTFPTKASWCCGKKPDVLYFRLKWTCDVYAKSFPWQAQSQFQGKAFPRPPFDFEFRPPGNCDCTCHGNDFADVSHAHCSLKNKWLIKLLTSKCHHADTLHTCVIMWKYDLNLS